MKFEEVLPYLKDHNEIRRECWREDDAIRLIRYCGVEIIIDRGRKQVAFSPSMLLANDWEVVGIGSEVMAISLKDSQIEKADGKYYIRFKGLTDDEQKIITKIIDKVVTWRD